MVILLRVGTHGQPPSILSMVFIVAEGVKKGAESNPNVQVDIFQLVSPLPPLIVLEVVLIRHQIAGNALRHRVKQNARSCKAQLRSFGRSKSALIGVAPTKILGWNWGEGVNEEIRENSIMFTGRTVWDGENPVVCH